MMWYQRIQVKSHNVLRFWWKTGIGKLQEYQLSLLRNINWFDSSFIGRLGCVIKSMIHSPPWLRIFKCQVKFSRSARRIFFRCFVCLWLVMMILNEIDSSFPENSAFLAIVLRFILLSRKFVPSELFSIQFNSKCSSEAVYLILAFVHNEIFAYFTSAAIWSVLYNFNLWTFYQHMQFPW